MQIAQSKSEISVLANWNFSFGVLQIPVSRTLNASLKNAKMTKSSLMGRIQVTRVKSIAERSAELQNLYLRTCNSDAMIGQVKDRPKQQDTPDQPNKQ